MNRSFDIFLIHSLDDLARVRPLAAALEASGWTVGWDVSALTVGVPHEAFVIERVLQQARCAVVVWSSVAEKSNAVLAEVAAVLRQRELIYVRLDDAPFPAELGDIAAIDFTGWDGSGDAQAFRALAGAVSGILDASGEAAGKRPADGEGTDRPWPDRITGAPNPSDGPWTESKPPRASGTRLRVSRLKRPLRWLLLAAGLLAGARLALDGYAEFRAWRARPPEENFNLQPQRLGPVMVVIPDGPFTMGSPAGEEGRYKDEDPQHEVRIAKPFALGRYEVTFDEYDEFAKATGRELPGDEGWGRARRPVINVAWDDAKAYAVWLSQRTGQRYRLPSEAEWEYAVRAGTATRRYWGDDGGNEQACAYTNVFDRRNVEAVKKVYGSAATWESFVCDDPYPFTAPVGNFQGNAFGLQDMLGNVWEWVEDCWHDSYQGAPNDGSAWIGGDCGSRVLRGGSWGSRPDFVRAAARYTDDPGGRDVNIGFRLARDLP